MRGLAKGKFQARHQRRKTRVIRETPKTPNTTRAINSTLPLSCCVLFVLSCQALSLFCFVVGVLCCVESCRVFLTLIYSSLILVSSFTVSSHLSCVLWLSCGFLVLSCLFSSCGCLVVSCLLIVLSCDCLFFSFLFFSCLALSFFSCLVCLVVVLSCGRLVGCLFVVLWWPG